MCGFFAFSTGLSAREIADRLNISNLPTSYEAIKDDIESLKHYPKSRIPTISKNSPNQLVMRYWSLVPRWWKKPLEELKFSTFNARAEDISEKATYRTPWKQGQRCLIPATWFYEFTPVKEGNKTVKLPYRVEDQDEIMTLAGLYETWTDDKGHELQSVTIITCEAEGNLAKIHDRQPVIIEEKDREKWLSKDTVPEVATKLLVPEKKLKTYQIDRSFNKAFGSAVTKAMVDKV